MMQWNSTESVPHLRLIRSTDTTPLYTDRGTTLEDRIAGIDEKIWNRVV